MKVILTTDVPELGHEGDVVDVADGYARNYLVPRALAVKVTRGAMAEAEKKRQVRLEAERRALETAEALADALRGARVVVAARAGDEGKLFGSIGTGDVAEAVHKFTGIELDRKYVQLDRPIKEIGLHEVLVRPHAQVEFQLTLDIIPA